MSGFTKLVPEIVLSSIWNESPEVRCVWIALIATKDKAGDVRGNPRSLARVANVSLEAVNQALERFQQPDPDSNNQELEGRRIQAIPGGWHIVSHSLYRAKDYREHEAERKQAWRERNRTSGTSPGQVPDCSVSVSASAPASGLEGGCKGGGNDGATPIKGASKGDVYTCDFEQFWGAYPRKVAKKKAFKAWNGAKDKPDVQAIIKAVETHKASEQWRKDGGQFIPHPATWLNAGQWEDVVTIAKQSKSADAWRMAPADPIPDDPDLPWNGAKP